MSRMYLTQTAEYALRAMAQIAAAGDMAALRAQDLTTATAIPLPYLSKILRRMVVGGLLVSQKGHGGGFVLAREPKEIRFADILAAADYDPDPENCAFGWRNCDPTNPCPLHPAWAQLKTAYATWAETVTLADILREGMEATARGPRPMPVSGRGKSAARRTNRGIKP